MKELHRKAGVLLHPTSFPAGEGIGSLGREAYAFVDFLVVGEQQLWQVLPLNPTGFGDSPYQSFSAFAGNTLLIDETQWLEQGFLFSNELSNHLPHTHVDFGQVVNEKNRLHALAYDRFSAKKAPKAYSDFCRAQAHWLDDYALFVAIKAQVIEERRNHLSAHPDYIDYQAKFGAYMDENTLADHYYGGIWNSWSAPLAKREPKALAGKAKELHTAIEREKFLQWTFFTQWGKLKAYANGKGIEIIGDAPIFVSIDSADVWVNTHLFELDADNVPTSVAGVPPDYFAADGQLWGNPLYKWDAHRTEGFAWWIARMGALLQTVDCVRLDHFRGFESYWSVPYGEQTAINGQWLPGIGAELFVALEKALLDKEATSLPIIAEDLGLITPEVLALRDELGLPGMKVLQFAYGDDSSNAYLPHNYDTNNCVVYTGTHDNDTTLGWYQSAGEKEKDLFRRYLNSSGHNPAYDLLRQAYASNAKWAIVPLQDILGQGSDARMNVPGVGAGNWQYRYQAHDLSETLAGELRYLCELFDRKVKPDDEEG